MAKLGKKLKKAGVKAEIFFFLFFSSNNLISLPSHDPHDTSFIFCINHFPTLFA